MKTTIRAMATALVLMLAAATAGANDDVQDVRLRVQNLTRPDGKQSATLTGIVLPGGQPRPVSATLQVGGTTVVLTGKIARNGRLRAVGRRLALAAPLASFTRIDLDLGGGLASLAMHAEECRRSPHGQRLDCVAAKTPTPTPTQTPTGPGELVDGVYDLVIAGNTPAGTTEAARMSTLGDGSRTLILYDGALESAFVSMSTELELSGYYFIGGDAAVHVEGSALDTSTSATSRLEATLTATGFLPEIDFIMQRDTAGTPSTLGGTWNVALHGGGLASLDGTMVLTSSVGADGTATTAPTTIEDANGTRYTLGASTCWVAPAGGVHCLLNVSDPPGVYQIQLHGFLDAAAGSGQGTFAIGAAPTISVQGSWTATR